MIHRGRPKECKHIYKDADEFFTLNDGDKELDPISINLPTPPPLYLITGYGKPHDEQYFKRLEIPDRLKDVQRRALDSMRLRQKNNKNWTVTFEKLITAFWMEFEKTRDYNYDEVAEYIKEVHWHRRHGYWFFNDGKPTYITGAHFDYLNYWTFADEKSNDGGYPEYRDIDRIVYLFREYAKTTTESVFMDEDGVVTVEDIGITICYGTTEPKSRRCGITGQALHYGAKTAMDGFGKYFTTVSMDGDNAQKHYSKKLVPAFNSYPIWLKPTYANQIGNSIVFDLPSKVMGKEMLGSVIDYTDSAGERKNDGDKIHFGLFDEEGKVKQANVLERWNVNKQAMALGARIIGFSIHPTTVEEMDVGGEEYMKLCNQSKFYERGERGQTISGLFEVFIPAWKRLEGFIDLFGMPVIDTPTERQIKLRPGADFARFKVGAKEFLQTRLDALVESGTPEDLEMHRSTRRKFPMQYSDCWIGSSGDLGFDMDIIDERLASLRRSSLMRPGRFEWSNGFGSDVRFEDDPEGRFELSMLLQPKASNQRMKIDLYDPVTGDEMEHWAPTNPYVFTASADPFKAGTSNEAKQMGVHTRQSDGGLAVLWEKDDELDGDKQNIRDWISRRFVCSYRYRPASLEDYKEDALKMCIYFGAMFYPERNVGDMDYYFIGAGYGGYLLYDINPVTGRREEKAGFASYSSKKENLFLEMKDYIRYRGHKEEHASFLNEVKSIQGIEQMNRYDRFTAHGGCLLGSKQNALNRLREDRTRPSEEQVKSVLDFWEQNF